MKVQDLVEELEETQSYRNFIEKNPAAFFAAGFFILDLKEKTETIHLDYFLPEGGKIATFEHPFGEPKIHEDIISVSKSGETEPGKVKLMQPQTTEIKIDIDDLGPTCKEIIKENESKVFSTKIIAILKDDQWNLTCMDDMLGVVRIKLNAVTGEQVDFNKGSLMDFMGIRKGEENGI